MNTTLSSHALSVIDQYLHFKAGNAVCSVPYFNNRTIRARASLRTLVGKGSPKDISDEVQSLLVKQHIASDTLADESLKKLLTDANIGIDCSGFAYYALDAESTDRDAGPLDKKVSFVKTSGVFGRIRAALRPAENCDVATLADDVNSHIVPMNEVHPGDIITMTGGPEGVERDHILVIHQVDQQNSAPMKIYYSHAVAYPEDGLYGSGIKQGTIEITDMNKLLTEQIWSEDSKTGEANRIHSRAMKSKTELRRLKWF